VGRVTTAITGQNKNPCSRSTRDLHPQKPRTQNSSGNLLATVFWDMEGILLIEHIKKGSRMTEVCKEICNQKVENCHTAKVPRL
jgi:hypothetical protein